jgi:DegV family protein with EDD domain
MAQRIALVTDSTSDIPSQWREQYHIQLVPLTIVFGDQQYLDGIEMTSMQFYERLQVDTLHPSTSQPSPQAFLSAYQHAAESGAEAILTVTISSAMSGTFENARKAAAESPIPVHVMDGKNTSMALGWQVMAAARVQESGGDLDEIIAAVEYAGQNMSFFVSLDTIEYLARGGRISEAAKFLNSVLRIKPLIYVNPESGTVGASVPSRSRKAAIQSLYKEFFRHLCPGDRLHVAVMHTDAWLEAEELADMIRKEQQPDEMILGIGSPVLGVHVGRAAIGLCGYREKD